MGFYLGDKLIASTTGASSLSSKEDLTNKVTNLDNPDDITYPTTNAVKKDLGNYVTLNTEQTITGKKTILNKPLYIKSNIDPSDPTQNNEMVILQGNDVNDTSISKIIEAQYSNFTGTFLRNESPRLGSWGDIQIRCYDDGSVYAVYNHGSKTTINIPDTGKAIPDMDKVNSRITSIMDTKNLIKSEFRSSTNDFVYYWREWNNGIIEQYGHTKNAVNSGFVVTFPKPFPNAVLTPLISGTNSYNYYASFTKTNMTINSNAAGTRSWLVSGY